MKKAIIALFLVFAGFGVFAQTGVIREISGTVELKAVGASSFTAASAGDQVRQDTVISTGFKSTALVEIGSTVIAVRPLTRLTLTEIQASSGSETLNVSLSSGRVRVDVNPPAGTKASMSISSPSATASVRGTSFYFDMLNCKGIEGTVGFRGSWGNSELVAGGFESNVSANGNVEDPYTALWSRLKPGLPPGSGKATGKDTSGAGEGDSSGYVGNDGTVSVGLVY
jgi:hypothetical protein